LEVISIKSSVRSSSFIFISASGRNVDIKFSFKEVLKLDPNSVGIITMKSNSPLTKIASSYNFVEVFSYNLPIGKDGFLATNSLIAYYNIFRRISDKKVFKYSKSFEKSDIQISKFLKDNFHLESLMVLYSGWGKSIAYDIESKCVEAGLINVLLSDYRNFGHGRHNWFDKRPNSAIVIIRSEEDFKISEKTISLLPMDIPLFILESKKDGGTSGIELLIKSFRFINQLGIIKGIDPGRPSVKPFGRKLYHMPYASIYKMKHNSTVSMSEMISVSRKVNKNYLDITQKEKTKWSKAYKTFISGINKRVFRMIVFDYDQTLCSTRNRQIGPTKDIIANLINILSNNIPIGIITGRGKSVRLALENKIPKKYHTRIILGYYNGSEMSLLSDKIAPSTKAPINIPLEKLNIFLKNKLKDYDFNMELRPNQLTVENVKNGDIEIVKNFIFQTVESGKFNGLKYVESSHSFDIIPETVSKQNINEYVKKKALVSEYQEILFIGDKGKWPGNDYQLLDSVNGLSVNEVSHDYNTCWNLAPSGIRNTAATLYYLKKITLKKQSFKIRFKL